MKDINEINTDNIVVKKQYIIFKKNSNRLIKNLGGIDKILSNL